MFGDIMMILEVQKFNKIYCLIFKQCVKSLESTYVLLYIKLPNQKKKNYWYHYFIITYVIINQKWCFDHIFLPKKYKMRQDELYY